MFKLIPATAALLLALGLVLAGCGSSDDEATLTKAQVIVRGDAICAKTDKAQEAALRSYSPENQKSLATKAGVEKLIVEVGLPPIQTQAEELSELGAPKDDDGTFDEIVEGMEQGVEDAEADPASMEEGPNNPFASVNKLAGEYGFKVCSDVT